MTAPIGQASRKIVPADLCCHEAAKELRGGLQSKQTMSVLLMLVSSTSMLGENDDPVHVTDADGVSVAVPPGAAVDLNQMRNRFSR
jgi:hypothetical protein